MSLQRKRIWMFKENSKMNWSLTGPLFLKHVKALEIIHKQAAAKSEQWIIFRLQLTMKIKKLKQIRF